MLPYSLHLAGILPSGAFIYIYILCCILSQIDAHSSAFVAVARTDRDANGRTTTKKMCVFLSAIYKFDEQIRECLIVCPLIIGTHVADDNAHAHAPKHSWTPTGTKCLSHASLLAFACQASFFGAQTTHSYNANTRRKVSSEHIKQKNRNKKNIPRFTLFSFIFLSSRIASVCICSSHVRIAAQTQKSLSVLFPSFTYLIQMSIKHKYMFTRINNASREDRNKLRNRTKF